MLVHAKPEPLIFPSEATPKPDQPKIVQRLVSGGIIPAPLNPISAWRQHASVRPVAEWALQTAWKTMWWIAQLPENEYFRDCLAEEFEFGELSPFARDWSGLSSAAKNE